jgi:hypothetical protein
MGAFWGEGSKKERFVVKVTNSDPVFIRMCIEFLTVSCGVEKCRFSPWVNLHKNCNEFEAVSYWVAQTGFEAYQINTQLVVSSASKNKKPINTLPYGTFCLALSDAKLARKIKGWLKGVKQQYMPN